MTLASPEEVYLETPESGRLIHILALGVDLGGEVLHVGLDEVEDVPPVHDREEVVEEEAEAGIELGHLGRLLVELGNDLRCQGGHHVQDVVVELLGEPGGRFARIRSSGFRQKLRPGFTEVSPVFPWGVESICSGEVLHHRLYHQLEEEPGAVSHRLPGGVPADDRYRVVRMVVRVVARMIVRMTVIEEELWCPCR